MMEGGKGDRPERDVDGGETCAHGDNTTAREGGLLL
jgi:hypothetical protein